MLSFVFCLFLQVEAAEFSVNNVYSDHMVLQRQKPIRISGEAPVGAEVSVALAENTAKAVAGKDERWEATLSAMEAGGPYEVTVKCGERTVKFTDVLIGEVWLCGGQSNMEFPVWPRRRSRFFSLPDGKEVAAKANHPQMRFYIVKHDANLRAPQTQVKNYGNAWQICSPQTVGPLSAVGYFFGKKLLEDLNVPIGLIHSNYSGTAIQSWMPEAALIEAECDKDLAEFARLQAVKVEDENVYIRECGEKWVEEKTRQYNQEIKAAENWKSTSFDDSKWEIVHENYSMSENNQGGYYYRKSIEIPKSWVGKKLELTLGCRSFCRITIFCNGQEIGATDLGDHGFWGRDIQHSIPAKLVVSEKLQIILRFVHLFRKSGFIGKDSNLTCPGESGKVSLNGEWRMKRDFKLEKPNMGLPAYYWDTFKQPNSTALYNAMIHPFTAFSIRGVIWYQGEANWLDPSGYTKMQPAMVKAWRKAWNDPEQSFVFTQLSSYATHTPAKRISDSLFVNQKPMQYPGFAPLREAQTATLKLIPNSGMAVTIDIGDHSDIHPANKKDVGERLAAEAERICYGRKKVSSGPMFDKVEFADGKAIVSFRDVGGGLVCKGDKLNAFAIAGKDKHYVWADAKIEDGKVIVSNPEVKNPQYVYYAFDGFPLNPNLYNKEGFPAVPFRSEIPSYLKNWYPPKKQ